MILTEKGFELPTIDEIYTRKLNDFKTVKPDVRTTDSNLIVSLLKFDAVEEYDSYIQALSVYNDLSVYTATGYSLGNITGHLNLTWLDAQKSVGQITIKANAGTVIPQAFGVETGDGIKFVTLNTSDVIIQDNATFEIIALNSGTQGNVRAGTINKMTTVINGVLSINNDNATYGGKEKETDTELRERYLRRLKVRSTFTTAGIRDFILNNTKVDKCQVIENDTDLTDEDGRLPHSYEPVCLGDTNENILQALYLYKIAGIRTVGDIKKQFGEISVGFSRPTEVNIDFIINIKAIKNIWQDDFKNTIKNIINDYIDSLEPQDTIYNYKLLGEIYKQTSGITTIDIKMKKTGTSQEYIDYELKKKEIAVVNDVNIAVVVV